MADRLAGKAFPGDAPGGVAGPAGGELRVVADVAAAFAEVVRSELGRDARSASHGGVVSLVLSGGSTARACYEELARTDGVPWSSIELLLGDERCVPPDDPDSNQRLVREALGDRIAQAAGFFPMDCSDPAGYARVVADRQPLDLVHLGLGPDGHTASLFPASDGLSSPDGELVVDNVDPLGNNPHPRLTLTFDAIAASSLVVFTVSGPSKREALARVLRGEDVPAARVRANRVLWLCDAEALGDATAGSGESTARESP